MICWIEESRLAWQAWLSIKDGESYVRASALTAISNISQEPTLWNSLTKQVNHVSIGLRVPVVIVISQSQIWGPYKY